MEPGCLQQLIKIPLRSDIRVHVWTSFGERLKHTFGLQRHNAPISGVMVWSDTHIWHLVTSNIDRWHLDSPAVHLVHPWATCVIIPVSGSNRYFSTRKCSDTHSKVSQEHRRPFTTLLLPCPISRNVTNWACLWSVETASWATYEFGRISVAITGAVEWDDAEHHTELVSISAHLYRILYSN